MIKVDDDVHALLKRSGNIRQAVREMVFGKPDLKTVLDQMHMRFDALGSPQEFSENTKEAVGMLTGASVKLENDACFEANQEKFLRIQKEAKELEVRRRSAAEHPEDLDQSGGWG